jgi:hypothetical protein
MQGNTCSRAGRGNPTSDSSCVVAWSGPQANDEEIRTQLSRIGQKLSEATISIPKAIWKAHQDSAHDVHGIVSEGTTSDPGTTYSDSFDSDG